MYVKSKVLIKQKCVINKNSYSDNYFLVLNISLLYGLLNRRMYENINIHFIRIATAY